MGSCDNKVSQRLIFNTRALLDKKKMRPSHLCKISGLDAGNLSKFLASKKMVSLACLQKIAEGCDVDIQELFAPKPKKQPTEIKDGEPDVPTLG